MEITVVKITVLITIILLSSAFHEAMHAYMSFRLGDDTALQAGRLSLNPLAHIDPIMSVALPFLLAVLGLPIFGAAKPVPFNPYRVRGGERGAALVAISGPLTNLALATSLALPLRFITLSGSIEGLIVLAILINLGFFVFNSLPIPPLDGSRLLYAFAPDYLKDLMSKIERGGLATIAIFVLIFSGLFGPLFVLAIESLFRLLTGVPLNHFVIM